LNERVAQKTKRSKLIQPIIPASRKMAYGTPLDGASSTAPNSSDMAKMLSVGRSTSHVRPSRVEE